MYFKKIFIYTFLFLFSGHLIAQFSEADLILNKLVSDKIIMGAAAGCMKDGEIIWQKTVGYSDKRNNVKFEMITSTRTASIAKTMTAIAIMQLYEKGLVDLDAPIQKYIPEFPKKSKNDITISLLLSHTSGVAGYKDKNEAETTISYNNLEDAIRVFMGRPLLSEPGTYFSYSTYGTTILGVVIERISGLSYQAYLKKNIWDNVGMSHTGVEIYNDKGPHETELYKQSKFLFWKGLKKAAENNLSNRIPGGGLSSTVEDLLKFGHAVMNNELIGQDAYDLMTSHHSLDKYSPAYGYGWFLYGSRDAENTMIGHGGEQTGLSAQFILVPEKNMAFIILSNTTGAWEDVSKSCKEIVDVFVEK